MATKPRLAYMDPLDNLSDESSDSESEEGTRDPGKQTSTSDNSESGDGSKKRRLGERQAGGAKSSVLQKAVANYEALKAHGYRGGPSVLFVPPPDPVAQSDWNWGKGHEKRSSEEEETFEERRKTEEALQRASTEGAAQAILTNSVAKQLREDAAKERKLLSFNQKEKRKRDSGQTSRGKNYVEEEKRLLRGQGLYSGFDT